METAAGRFVNVDSIGPARVIKAGRSDYTVECFISPWRKEVRAVPRHQVGRLKLAEQTRVYVQVEGIWKTGRVVLDHERNDGGYSYDVQFPNHNESRHDEEELYCRCWFPADDPTTTLAIGAMETQFWHDRRQGFTEILLAQRAACRGFSALISSRIELIPHQVEVARRVLEDPLQRYLLADEVGMGKTIEAGLVIRQFLLSNSAGKVLVVVPRDIVRQWQRELEEKFVVSEFPERVDVVSITSLEDLDLEVDDVSLLVIDEAHAAVVSGINPILQEAALTIPRLLLLSATPSLGDPKILLKLLRLIDPDCYSDVSFEQFSERVAKREEIGIFLRGLRSDASPAILRQRLRRLPELLPGDKDALALAAEIAEALAADAKDALRKSINEMRAHVADVHRIHHRLVRTRRCDAADWVFTPRGPAGANNKSTHVDLQRVEDPRFAATLDILEQWRVETASRTSQAPGQLGKALSGFLALFEALGCGIECFRKKLDTLPTELVALEWRDALRTAIDGSEVNEPRAKQVANALRQYIYRLQDHCRGRSPRIVVFGSDIADIQECADAFSNHVGSSNVYCHVSNPTPITDFLSSQEFGIYFCALFCSREEEEGLNLHMFDAVVHLDLPFSPTRMEQRIGRLDRFGRKTHVSQLVFLPKAERDLNLWEAWHEVLSDGFRIFTEPIADVQFALEKLMDVLAESLFVSGAAGLRSAMHICQQHLFQERDRLDNQYALDRVFQDEDAAGGFFDSLDALEEQEEEIAEATKAWAIDALQLSHEGDYRKLFHLNCRHALLPAMMRWAILFRDGIKGGMTFKRRLALNPPTGLSRPKLLRTGSPLMFALESLYQWDDRGKAFATWRQVPDLEQEEWLGFKLCYIVEFRIPEGLSADKERSMKSRGDGYLPPWSEVLYVDANLEVVEDPVLLERLTAPYNAKGRDYNLGSRLDALYQVIDSAQFEKLCHLVREQSETWLRESATFKERLAGSIERGQVDIKKRIRRLTARRSARAKFGELEDTGLLLDMEINEKLAGVLQNPIVKLDAIGAVILSGRSPDDLE